MSSNKLTDAEARQLIEMTKRSLINEINLPSRGKTQEFDVVGDTKKDLFTINIFRGRIQSKKYNIGARIKKNGILLLELHINPTAVHCNPSGEKVRGSHWHIYTEQHGRTYAFPADNIQDDTFVNNTILFLKKFNVIEQPELHYQMEL